MIGLERWAAAGAIAFLAFSASAASEAAAAPKHRRCHHCRGPFRLQPYESGVIVEPFPEQPPSYGVPLPDLGPEFEPQFVPEPSPNPGRLPYPQGFALDVPVRPNRDGAADAKPPEHSKPLNRYREVADALAACWAPPADFDDHPWRQVTLRVSFKRDGTINGTPRIPHVDEGLTEAARSDLTQSLTAALRRCTPLALSPGLGAAIAGQIFALRFIEQEPER